MALIPIRIDRTSKPPIGTPLRSDGHWSVQGIDQSLGVWPLNDGAKLPFNSNGKLATSNTAKWDPEGLNCTSSFVSTGCAVPNINDYTIIIGGYATTSPTVMAANALASGSHGITIISAGTSVYARANSGGSDVNTAAVASSTGSRSNVAAVIDRQNNALSIYSDGVFGASVSIASLGVVNSVSDMQIGARNSTLAIVGKLFYVIPYRSALSPAQIASISTNPWQIYEPETFWIEVGGSGSETRDLIAAITGQSTTTSIQATALRTLLAAVSGESLTSTIQATLARALLASVAGSSFTPGIEATLSGIISLVASIPAQSLSSTAQATIDRALTAIISGQSGTPSISALVQGIISLVASVSEQSSTPSVAVTTARLLLAAIDGASSTASARATIARGLAAIVSGQSNTPGVAAMLANMVSLAAGISAHSTTPAALATLQRDMMAAIHAATSTGIISASTSRAMSAVIEGQSLTPDNIMATLAGLGLVLDTSIESRTIIRTLQSLTKKYTIHSI